MDPALTLRGVSFSASRSPHRSVRSACWSFAARCRRDEWWVWRRASAWRPLTRRMAPSPRSGSAPSPRRWSDVRHLLGLVGGLFLLWLAWKTARAEPHDPASARPRRGGPFGAYLSILGLTLTNPMTILSFGALFAGLGVTSAETGGAALVTLGVLVGSRCLVGGADVRGICTTNTGHVDLGAADQYRIRDRDRSVRRAVDRDGRAVAPAGGRGGAAGRRSERGIARRTRFAPDMKRGPSVRTGRVVRY